jgi:phosphatidylserine/phosphatidylglycerophosphate/cardiolipin synthase-like enzyme
VYFRNISDHLLLAIGEADIVVGSIAWLTDSIILEALADTDGVAIVVQKKDLLRPDLEEKQADKEQLMRLYSALPRALSRIDHAFINTVLYNASPDLDLTIDPVRMVGVRQKSSHPKAHNKFIVLCKYSTDGYQPYAVWTGSYNFTRTSQFSFENAVVLRSNEIATAYFSEFAQLEALSEPINWVSVEVDPQWRIQSEQVTNEIV